MIGNRVTDVFARWFGQSKPPCACHAGADVGKVAATALVRAKSRAHACGCRPLGTGSNASVREELELLARSSRARDPRWGWYLRGRTRALADADAVAAIATKTNYMIRVVGDQGRVDVDVVFYASDGYAQARIHDHGLVTIVPNDGDEGSRWSSTWRIAPDTPEPLRRALTELAPTWATVRDGMSTSSPILRKARGTAPPRAWRTRVEDAMRLRLREQGA